MKSNMSLEPDFPLIMQRTAVALVCGIFLGAERALRYKPAGIRTHVLISIGSCLFMLISEIVAENSRRAGFPTPDPARIAAQVVTGIGFLGAGALIRNGNSIKGLTSAATIWCMAAIGLAAGAGLLYTALAATVIIIVLLQFFQVLEKAFGARKKKPMILQVALHKSTKTKQIKHIRKMLRNSDIHILKENIENIFKERQYQANIYINKQQEENLTDQLQDLENVVDVLLLQQGEALDL